MALKPKIQKIVDTIQWICIGLLLIICLLMHFRNRRIAKAADMEIRQEQTFLKIYESQKMDALKRENKHLYDSIKNMKDVESAIEVKYKYQYVIDTIRVTDFQEHVDSIYHYTNETDTVTLNIDVKAKEVDWIKGDFTLNESFSIVNRRNGDQNQLLLYHSNGVNIDKVDAWHQKQKKSKWYTRFVASPQLGVGYGIVNKKGDVFVGVGLAYDFGK